MNTSRLSYSLIFLYCLCSILFPVFIFNKLLYVPLILASLLFALVRKVRTISPFVVFGIFLYGFLLSFFNQSDFALSKQMLLGCTTLFFIYFIDHENVDMTSILKAVGLIFAAFMCGMSLLVMLLPGSALGAAILNFYTTYELGFYGVRQFGGLQMFMLHHRSSPFLLVPLSLFFLSFMAGRRRDVLWISLILLCIFFTASRALMLMAALAMLVLFLYRSSWLVRMAVFSTLVPVALGGLAYLWMFTGMFSPTETSNSIKLGHLVSFYDSVDVSTLLLGNGSGSYFFSSGYDRWVAQTEITWMDSIRFFGAPLSIILLGAILFPTGQLFFRDWRQVSARTIIVIYLIMSFSNPVLFNSFGFIVVLWYWSQALLVDDEQWQDNYQEERIVNE